MSENASEQTSGPAPPSGKEGPSLRRRLITRGLLLLITGVSLYGLAPSLLEVFSSWRQLATIEPAWLAAMVLFQAASFFCIWHLQRVALGTKQMFSVATSQLAGNAIGRVIPGGAATAAALQYRMLAQAGVPTNRVASALLAVTLLMFATVIALPILSIPAIIGGAEVHDSLALTAGAGLGVFFLMAIAGAVFVIWDRPLVLTGLGIQWLLNKLRRKDEPRTGLPTTLLRERDFILTTFGKGWWQALLAVIGKWAFDYLTLMAALLALGADADMWIILLAYVAAQLLGMIPITPGGLGFVEAGLTGMLVLAGIGAGDAAVATLMYRLASFWLPLPAGAIAYGLFQYRYRDGIPARAPSGT